MSIQIKLGWQFGYQSSLGCQLSKLVKCYLLVLPDLLKKLPVLYKYVNQYAFISINFYSTVLFLTMHEYFLLKFAGVIDQFFSQQVKIFANCQWIFKCSP
eukprot:TRINITY_DN38253_c0_g1_i1.p2 TRINITY_DN38253_c0_g1~~TRINITY_DN38253_c0_g1_i1.p2  ORF type:complete len:100 (+),score=0.10 TRINITY_DN38253_c0_g1_i1:56-355(+)